MPSVQATKSPPIDTKAVIADATTYPAGKSTLPVVDIPVNTKETLVSMSRDGLPDLGPSTPVVEISQWFSFDSGVTWEFGGASEHIGGEYRHRDGFIMPENVLKLSGLPDDKNPGRKIRVEIKSVVPLSAKVSFEARSKISIPSLPEPIAKARTEVGAALLADEADPFDPGFDPDVYLAIWKIASDLERANMLRDLNTAGVVIVGINADPVEPSP